VPDSTYAGILHIAAILIWASLPAAQWVAFRELERRGGDAVAVFGKSVRDHVLAALLRAGGLTLVQVPLAFLIWSLLLRTGTGWNALDGAEILFAAGLFVTGVTAVSVRFCLGLLEKVEDEAAARRWVFLIRISVLAAGAAYGLALWLRRPGGVLELFVSLVVLGVALLALGLNRTAGMSPGVLVRLADALRKR